MRQIHNYESEPRNPAQHERQSRPRVHRSSYAYKPAKAARPAAVPRQQQSAPLGREGRTAYRQKRHGHADRPSQKYAIWNIVFFPLAILYYELLMRIALGEPLFKNFFFILFFSVSAGCLWYSICHLPRKFKTVRILSITALALFALLFLVEYFCKQFFTFFMGISVLFDSAGEVMGSYFGTAVSLVLRGFHIVALYFVPTAVYAYFFRRPAEDVLPTLYRRILPAVLAVLCYIVGIIGVHTSNSGIVSNKEYYTSEFNITESSLRFGLMTGFRLDAQYLIFGTPEAKIEEFTPSMLEPLPETETSQIESSVIEEVPVVYDYNIMDIDLRALAEEESDDKIASMHNYFASLPGTMQNEYTGLFEGKNLIVITAEAFSDMVIDPELTPTLYRLANEGIKFTNYYQPAWGVSTSDGEYSHIMGLVPKSGTKSMRDSASNNVYFTLGNQTRRLGYLTLAYHNNSHTYYDRNKTHPNLGYSKFIAIGSGLEGTDSVWPRSDLQMFQNTVDDYLYGDQPFSVYYMTVSGHCEYNFSGNMMAARNKDAVAHLDYSEPVRAYLACNLELEYAMKYLLEQLELAGKMDDTVIVMTSDHYPYGFENSAAANNVGKYTYFNELAGHEIETNAEIHKNACIIWSGCIEDMDIVVDEPCYSLDILPTVSNLFGLEYDSRMLTGRDVFSGEMPLVLFRNYSWITDRGYYNAKAETFTPAEGVTFESEDAQNHYIKYVSNLVKNKINYAKYILEEDYYGVLFGEE